MPIYQYKCNEDHVEEVLCAHEKRADVVVCSKCGNVARLLLSMPSLTPSKWGDFATTYKK